jgi:DMSO/TMAO reductase YedYZ molybdopterin-dependent catalytic subunit
VNKTSGSAGVVEAALDPGWRLGVEGRVARPMQLSLEELRSLPARRAVLPIACVDGWSASATWDGVPLRDLLALAGAEPGRDVRVVSLQAQGSYRSSDFTAGQADDPDTLLAYAIDGEPLHIDHGYPVRLIAPNRPGVLQTKWVARVVVR